MTSALVLNSQIKANDKSLIKLLEEKPVVQKRKPRKPVAKPHPGTQQARLYNLAEKILNTYSDKQIESTLGSTGRTTVLRWRRGSHKPHPNTITNLKNDLLKVTNQTWEDYYEKGKISIMELWKRRGELTGEKPVSPTSSILLGIEDDEISENVEKIRNLDESKRNTLFKALVPDFLHFLGDLINVTVLGLTEEDEEIEEEVEEQEPVIILDEMQKERLKTLVRASMNYEGDEKRKELGNALNEDFAYFLIADDKNELINEDFPRSQYEILAPYLLKVMGWSKSISPIIDISEKYENFDQLLIHLQKTVY